MADQWGTITSALNMMSVAYPAEEFVGREWLVKEVAALRDDPTRRQILLKGEPAN